MLNNFSWPMIHILNYRQDEFLEWIVFYFTFKKCHPFFQRDCKSILLTLKLLNLFPSKTIAWILRSKTPFQKNVWEQGWQWTLISFHSQKPCRLNIFPIWTLIFLILVLVLYFSASNLKKRKFFLQVYIFLFILFYFVQHRFSC